jgi:hypothetical protein
MEQISYLWWKYAREILVTGKRQGYTTSQSALAATTGRFTSRLQSQESLNAESGKWDRFKGWVTATNSIITDIAGLPVFNETF